MAEMDLGGSWVAHESAGDLPKSFANVDFDDTAWAPITVPGHWRSTPAFADSDGPLLCRRRFAATVDGDAAPERWFLELDGCFYYGDVWLDGTYVGATEGYFVPHAFDVTDVLAERDDHVLGIEVACPQQRDRTAKRTITGVFSHWDNLDPTWNPGGLWRPLRLRTTGPMRIDRMRVLCTEASVERGRLRVDLTVDVAPGGDTVPPALVVATVHDEQGNVVATYRRDLALAHGDNHLTFAVAVENPARWWPHRLGGQPRYRVDVEVHAHDTVSDRRSTTTAFREVRFHDWTFTINGERLYVMGSNQGPARMALAEATLDELRGDVDRAIDANLDLLRVHGHVTRPEFYDAADERGLLVWQDFPLQWGYARSVRKQAVRQARAMVDLLGHRPSVVLWCAHNEPLAVDVQPGAPMRAGNAVKLGASMFLPTWNKDVLDRSIARQIGRGDPTRPVVRHSGVLPSATSRGTDTHAYFGWYMGDMAGLAAALRTLPRLARFVTEFGAQAVPSTCEWMEPERWPDLDWDVLFERHALQRRVFDRYVPPADCKSFDEWRDATQAYQAALLQLQIEDLRRVKYAPGGGFAQFCFADGHRAVTWSVLDHARVPKRGYAALRDACRPVLPMLEPREGLVHVVSERRSPLHGATIDVHIDGRTHRFGGDIGADAVTYVGRVELGDAVDVELVLDHPAIGRVANRYPLLVLDACRADRRR